MKLFLSLSWRQKSILIISIQSHCSFFYQEDEEDLQLIKDELSDYGYMKSHGKKKGKKQAKSKPLHFVSSDGFHMYVGKNNYQNDELSFKFANGGDWWFHAKNMAGSLCYCTE